ncbi:hypothetical protein RRG08_043114 [Elysia crispata]|uniref:SWIM-type domain-containing protein n=1 Tax=Elysia crispata TaxID=231223 RepID=A0AAE0XY73_9GAST|nr:hypothetical protein RRG08_043114 [Elysia crispata]
MDPSLGPGKRKSPFGDLGKPTLRGIRKCPKCGTFNGTRGISCKNKQCDVVFKERERKKGHSAEAVKIITGSTFQLYSVRLRNRGPDYRAFVQLPYIQDVDGNPATVYDTSVLVAASLCFVDSCNRNGNAETNTVMKSGVDACVHIRSAINCVQQAQPLGLKNTILDSLQVNNDMRQAIWLLATETSGPVVQRVTKSIMVVKCKVTAKQPLGFLHCAFYETLRNRQQPEYKFQCTCRAFKVRNSHTREDVNKRCVHFYACICAFASDEKLAEEFAHYINMDQSLAAVSVPLSSEAAQSAQILSMYPDVEDSLSQVAATDTDTMEVIIAEDDLLIPSPPEKRVKKEDQLAQASSALLTLQEQKQPVSLLTSMHTVSTGPTTKGSTPPPTAPQPLQFQIQSQSQPTAPQQQTSSSHHGAAKYSSAPRKISYPAVLDEYSASVSFQQWLASVTERINQTMHYGFSGTPDPLVFHAPQLFFECLQQRISAGTRKKRLPNFTTGFVRKEALPLGSFTKYTWHITNIAQVKQIFDSSEIALDLTRTFVENRGGTFEPYEPPRPDAFSESKHKNHTPIRPFELKTYLKVGQTNESKEPTPFIIEWIPDILPRSHIGELRIKFEYGHQRNGQIENRNSSANLPTASSSDLTLQSQTVQFRKILSS